MAQMSATGFTLSRVKPHIHNNLDHSDDGITISDSDRALINRIKKEFHLK